MKVIFSTSALVLLASTALAQTFNIANYPPVNAVPPVNSPQMTEWLKDINLADVPKLALHPGNPPAPCPLPATIPADQCWWTCQQCLGTDYDRCPNAGDWGITFDDGPTPNTIPLLATLKANNVKATFFVMGSNVVRNAPILKQEYDEGHHIASHTWSHFPLTSLSNEQIVAEVKWTEKAVFEITGLRMKYIRPPYGDIDNRVRSVISKLGYRVVDWTDDAADSKDFALNAKYTEATLAAGVNTMATHLTTWGANPANKGIITLEHDLYNVTVTFAKLLLDATKQAKLKPMTVAQCLGDNSPYQTGTTVPMVPGGGENKPNGTNTANPNGPVVKSQGSRMSHTTGVAIASILAFAVLAF
ncbi:chitin deacetylase [Podila minutissima]|nr:chitin deacetylase [Podila minutissima]